ncbi:target of EGR1 protein 1 [Gastrophryne carolinensis]
MTTLQVPVIDVHNENFSEIWPSMLLALKTSTFIAVDTELSGLGSRKSLLNQCIEERYKAICQAARSRSILSLGLACFKLLPEKGEDVYLSQIYNLTLLCMEDYTIEPQSVQFLVQHGFDFNKQYSCGIPYYKGNDKGDERHLRCIRTLFLELLQARKPLALHNGLIDLAFLYQCFHAQLPDKMVNFVADLSEMFPAGIYDTKYATEFETRFQASYLEYAYKKCKRENGRRIDSSSGHLSIEFCHYGRSMSAYVDYRLCSLPDQDPACSGSEPPHICEKFSAYGWCPNGQKCALSHNIDLIIDEDEKVKADRKKRRRKRKKAQAEETIEDSEPLGKKTAMNSDFQEEESRGVVMMEEEGQKGGAHACVTPSDQSDIKEIKGNGDNTVGTETDLAVEEKVTTRDKSDKQSAQPQKKNVPDAGTHRAGFDAFMTGYIMAYVWMLKRGDCKDSPMSDFLPDCRNRIYLSGKDIPLHIVKSVFAKCSRNHAHKMKMMGWHDS